MTITTETDRFLIRPFTADDIDFLDQLHSDPEVMRYILGRPRSHEENLGYLDNLLQMEAIEGLGQRLVIRKEDNQPVGRCGFSFFCGYEESEMTCYVGSPAAVPPGHGFRKVIELGYTFLRETWGQGYASEAAEAMRHHGHNVQKISEIHSIIDQANAGSVKVAERMGATRLGACLCLGSPGWDYLSQG